MTPTTLPLAIERISEHDAASGKLRGTGVRIRWSNGQENLLSSELLRRECPCASCREVRGDTSHAKPLSGDTAQRSSLLRVIQADADEETDLERVWTVGNYALGIRFADRHDSGIYTYEFLLSLSRSETVTG